MTISHLTNNEQKRINQLSRYDLLNLRKLPELDVFAEAVCLITDCPVSLIAIMEENIQTVQSCVGLELDTVDRKDTICQFAVESKKVLVIEDTLLDDRSRHNQLMMAANVRFYAGVPLLDAEGFVLGTICAIDFKPGVCTKKQLDSLQKLANAVTKMLTVKKQNLYAEYFFETLSITNNLICVLDTSLRFKECNPAFRNMFSETQNNSSNQTFNALFTLDHQAQKAIDLLQETKESAEFTSLYFGENATEIIVEWQLKFNSNQTEIFCFGRNVTQERQEKAKLENSERKFKMFFENAIGLMSMHDLDGNIIEVNQKGRELLQYSEEEVTQLNLNDLLANNKNNALHDYLERIKEYREDTGMMVLKAKDGKEFIWMYYSMLSINENGESFVVSTALNMTERIKLERDLRATKELLEQINKVAQVGGWELNVETKKIMWSDYTKKIHGVSENFEPNLEKALAFFEDDSKIRIEELLKQAIENGHSFDVELQLIKEDHSKVWVRIKGIPQFDNNVCKRIFGIIQDINETKTTYLELATRKSMLQAFINNVPATVAMFDTNLNYLAVSNHWLKEFNINFDEIEGENLFTINPEVPEERVQIYNNALLGIPYKNENQIFDLKGLKKPQNYSWEVLPWRLQDGSIGGIIALFNNITEAVSVNRELKALRKSGNIASKAKSEFLANMSHEIRTPLNGVIGFSDLLLKTPLNELQEQYLNYINESGTTLLNIINDILDFSKIESGKLELLIDKHNIYEVANQVINVILYQAQQKNIELLLNIEQGLPKNMSFDDIRMKQVLINLLGNALKFTNEGEIELKIEKVSSTNETIKLRFSVIDSGIGIPLEKQQRIFDAFTQEDSSVSKKYGGTGLGLTISNNILKYMQSNLSLQSDIGKGSNFFFEIEFSYDDQEAIDEDIIPIKRVLIIDDNEKNRIILKEMLRYKNIDSVQTSNGFDAIQMLLNGEEFDMILIDYHMPILSGIETLSKIKELFDNQDKNAPFVILHTSSQEQKVLTEINEYNNAYCLLKPVTATQLYKTIQKVLQQNSQGKSLENKANTVDAFHQKLNILVVDDNIVNRALNKRIMQQLTPNALLVEATDGEEAVSQCQNQFFDLILMDVQMPNMDGIQATKIIRQLSNYQNIPIIGVTAGNVMGEKDKCLQAGMSNFLAKPIKQNDVFEMLEKYLRIQQPITISDFFDEKMLEEQTGNDADFKEYFLTLVVQEFTKSKEHLLQTKDQWQNDEVHRFLHKLKGTAATAGFYKLAQIAADFEKENLTNEKYLEMNVLIVQNIDIALEILNEITNQ